MAELEPFLFLHPGWLLALPLAWWLAWYLAQRIRRNSMWLRICDPHLLARLPRDTSQGLEVRWLALVLAVVLSIGLVAAAGPSWRNAFSPTLESAGARVIVLDLSRAMLVEDVKPNRFAQALAGARAIISMPYGGETGLVVFAGAAFVVTPLSEDANTLLSFLDALNPEIMPLDGNRIDLGINGARQLLEASLTGSGHIILVTAGNEVLDTTVRAAFAARKQGHRVSVVAVGTSQGGPLKSADGSLRRDNQGGYVLSRTNFAELERIAEIGNGVFMSITPSASNVDLLASDFEHGDQSVDALLDDQGNRERANDGPWLVWLMLPPMLLLFRRNMLCLILLAVLLPQHQEVRAVEDHTPWRHAEQLAFDAYTGGQFELARELATTPLLKGAALYRLGRYQDALDWFLQDESAVSMYNRGNTYAQLRRFPEAVIAYQRALELDSTLVAAAQNKRLVENFLARQQAADNAANDPANNGGETDPEEDSLQAQIGVAGQNTPNPADEPDPGSGSGASVLDGQPGVEDMFDGSELTLERFLLQQGETEYPDIEVVERWISNLPEASSELFRRKFLRDYQRQKQQGR